MPAELSRSGRSWTRIQLPPAVLTKMTYRRLGQRVFKRYWRKNKERKSNTYKKELENKINVTTKYLEQECKRRYGFHADPKTKMEK
jgi:hypothetical protein